MNPARVDRDTADPRSGNGFGIPVDLTRTIGACQRTLAALTRDGAFKDAAAFNKKVRLLWIGAGTAEVGIHQSSKAMSDALDRAGVKTIFVESKDTAHEWQTWRKARHDFAPRLFRDGGR